MALPSWALLPLFSVVLGGCLGVEYGWQPQKEYWFSVQGQDLAGLPQLKPQYAGFLYNGELHVQSHSPRVLLLKFFNMNYTKIHEELSEGWWNGPESPSKNKTKIFPVTTSTVVVKLTKFMSPELVVQAGLDDWQVNFIKGIVNNILAYPSETLSSGPNSNRLSPSQPKDVLSVIEDSVVGRCEVLYEVSQLPRQIAPDNSKLCDQQQLWEVTKTRNYGNCQLLSEDHAHLPNGDCTPGGANCGHFWTRASLTRMVGCGEKNNFVLLNSVSSSTINAQLHLQNNSQAVINSNLNITLISVLDLKKKFNPPQNKQILKTLLYSYSTSEKDNDSNLEEEKPHDVSNTDRQEVNSKIDPKKKYYKTIKESDKTGKGNSGSRDKRGIKKKNGNQFKTESNESFERTNKYGNDYSSNKRLFYDENRKEGRNSGKHKPMQKSSDESIDQPSEEMQLEEQWTISGKDSKKNPPHQPFNMFTLAHRTSYDLSCLNPKLRQIISDVASDLEEINILPERNTMDKLSLAVDICRSLPLDQLTSAAEEVFEVHNGANIMKNNERRVFRDVVTMCGTHPALHLIKGWVERQQVEGEEAAQMIASLPSHIISPTNYLIKDFFEMVQQITEKEDKQLTTTAVLALSNLVRDACVNRLSRQHHFSSIIKPVCDQSVVNQVIEWLSHQMSSEPHLRRVYIEALGNIGSPDIIASLKNIVLSSKYSSYLQTSAVFAMRYQVLQRNPEVAPLLMSVYHNYSLSVGTRIAAAALLVYSNPGLAQWQRLAISTWYEPSPAVAQFVATTLHTMATSRDSVYDYVAKSAQLVQPLARSSKVNIYQPFNLLTSWLSSDLEKIILEQLSWMQFYDFTNTYYRHCSRYSGFSRTNIEASFAAANMNGLWKALKELIFTTNDNQSARPPTGDITHTFAKIQETLGLHSRSMPQMQAELHLKINNIMERMLIINNDTFKSWAEGGRKTVSQSLRKGESLSYQKADMNSFHISTTTELGFPVEFTVRTPWIVQAKGGFNFTDEGTMVEASFLYSSQLLSSVNLMSAWDNTAHSAGAYATNFVQLPPFQLTANLDAPMEAAKLTTTYIDQHRLLYFSMQPFTSQRKLKIHQATLLSPDTIRVKIGESIQMPISWMSHYLNTVYSSEEQEHFHPLDFIKQTRGIVGFPMMMPNMEARSFETVMNPLHPIVMNISMSMAKKSMGLLEVESSRDIILGQLYNALTKTRNSEQSPPTSSVKPKHLKPVNSTHTEQTQQSPKATDITTNATAKDQPNKESSTETKTKQFISEEKVLMRSSAPNIGDYQVYSSTYESATGSFNASQVDPFTNLVNGSGNSYLTEQILDKINSGNAVVFGFNMWSTHPEQQTKLSAYAAYAITYSKRASRFGFFMKKDSSQMKITSAFEVPVDIATDLKRRVAEDLQHNAFVDYIYISAGQAMNIFTKARFGISRPRLTQLRTSPLLDACSQMGSKHFDSAVDLKCQELLSQAKELSFGNITVYYNEHAKFLENTVLMYMNTAKVMLPRTEEKAGEGYNTMALMFDVYHRTNINSYITTPTTSISIRRLPLSKIMSTITELAVQDNSPTEFCGISTQRVRTFDRAEFQYRMKDSWHLVTQDCSGQYGISLIAQPTSNSSMMIELNINDHFAITVEEGPKVYVNNKLQPLDSSHALLLLKDRKGHIIAHTVFTPDNSIHILLPQDKLDLLYSGTSLIIRAEKGLQGRLCGLCGSYTNTGTEQFLTAHGSVAGSPAEFAASYMFKGSKSQHKEINS